MKIDLIDNADQPSTANEISWTRLVDQLRNAGEFQPNEVVARIEVLPRGLRYFVSSKGEVT